MQAQLIVSVRHVRPKEGPHVLRKENNIMVVVDDWLNAPLLPSCSTNHH